MEALKAKIKGLADQYYQKVVEIREHLHAHPELSFQEVETSKYVASQLEAAGIPFESGIVDTGIVGYIRGNNPDSYTLALRGDMDALPIQEENDVAYKSTVPGVMHACGHDVHTASLLGAAFILNALKEELTGTIKLIFQPGEERLPGGASLMIKAGVLENPKVETILGQHVFPDLEAGQVGFKSGMYMASCDELYMTVTGRGGHAAMPHKNVDPILITSHIIVALQQIVSRHSDPAIPTVLSFGKIIGEGATNIIPNEVKLEGTFRTFDETWRSEAHAKMIKLAHTIAESMGGSCELRVDKGYPFLVNHTEKTEKARSYAQEFLGAENVKELPIRMTAEDFSYYSQSADACFYRLGVANNAAGINKPVHNSQFDIDAKALETSIGLMSWLAARMLADQA